MQYIRYGMVVIAILIPFSGVSQQAEFIWEPEFSYSWKHSDRLAFNSKTTLFNSIQNLDNSSSIEHIETAFSFAYNLTVRMKAGGGYLYRLTTPLENEQGYEHRLMQQAAFVSFIGDRRLSHRFRTEQRFRSSSYVNRWRYRLSYDFPLEGERLDPGEWYMILSNELLSSFNSDNFEGENRINAGMGWLFNSKRKLEINLEYRAQDFFTGDALGHVFLIATSFYLNR